MPDPEHSDLSKLQHLQAALIAGSIAGGAGIFIGHPFDSLKVRIQTKRPLDSKTSLFSPQGIRTLYRGVLPPFLTAGILQAILFSNYEAFRILLRDVREIKYTNIWPFQVIPSSGSHVMVTKTANITNVDYTNMSRGNPAFTFTEGDIEHLEIAFWAGGLAGLTLSTISTPIGFLKIQQQVCSENNLYQVARDRWNSIKLKGMYRGGACNIIMEGPGRCVYLFVYEFVKMMINKAEYSSDGNNSNELYDRYGFRQDFVEPQRTRMIGAAVAGCASWCSMYPFDVIKSRLQLDYRGEMYTGTWDCIKKTYVEGGVRAFYAGMGYTLIRAAPVAATILPIYEWTKDKVIDILYT